VHRSCNMFLPTQMNSDCLSENRENNSICLRRLLVSCIKQDAMVEDLASQGVIVHVVESHLFGENDVLPDGGSTSTTADWCYKLDLKTLHAPISAPTLSLQYSVLLQFREPSNNCINEVQTTGSDVNSLPRAHDAATRRKG